MPKWKLTPEEDARIQAIFEGKSIVAHYIKESELLDYIEDQRQAWRLFARAGEKRLEFQINNVAPLFRVIYQERVTYIGALKESAVREYNSLPS